MYHSAAPGNSTIERNLLEQTAAAPIFYERSATCLFAALPSAPEMREECFGANDADA
jgi:hypothetical protein